MITVNNTAAAGAAANNTNKKVIFKHCAPFTNCISKINNIHVDNAEYIDTVMPMYKNYSKTSGTSAQITESKLLLKNIYVVLFLLVLF